MDPRTLAPRGTKATRPRTGPVPGSTGRGSEERTRRCQPQVRRTFGVPRAVFLGLLRRTSGGLTFQAPSPFSFGCSACPPLSGPRQRLAVGSAVRRCIRRSSGDARLAHRDPAAWAAARGLANPPRGHRPNRPGCPRSEPRGLAAHLRRRPPAVPALERPRARPRMGRGGRNIVYTWDFYHICEKNLANDSAPERVQSQDRGAPLSARRASLLASSCCVRRVCRLSSIDTHRMGIANSPRIMRGGLDPGSRYARPG